MLSDSSKTGLKVFKPTGTRHMPGVMRLRSHNGRLPDVEQVFSVLGTMKDAPLTSVSVVSGVIRIHSQVPELQPSFFARAGLRLLAASGRRESPDLPASTITGLTSRARRKTTSIPTARSKFGHSTVIPGVSSSSHAKIEIDDRRPEKCCEGQCCGEHLPEWIPAASP